MYVSVLAKGVHVSVLGGVYVSVLGGVYVSVVGGVYVSALGGVYVSALAQSACLSVCTPTDTDIHASCQHVAQNACLSVCTLTDTVSRCPLSLYTRTHTLVHVCVYSISLHIDAFADW